MSRDLVLAALAAAEQREGNLHWAHRTVRRADPLRRAGLRRQVDRAAQEAQDLSGGGTWGEQGPRHLMRVAYLIHAGADPTQEQIADLDVVQGLYDAERGKHPAEVKARWTLTFGLILVLVAGGVAGALVLLLNREATPSLEGKRRVPPPPAGAYARGGVPRHHSVPLDTLFKEELVNAHIAATRLGRYQRRGVPPQALRRLEAKLRSQRKAALAPRYLRALGEHAAKRLADLLETVKVAALAKSADAHDHTARAFQRAVSLLNRELAAGDFGYHVIGDVLVSGATRLLLLATYRVERVVLRTVNGRRVSVLHLDRLDQTNWTPNRLGAARPDEWAPFVEMSTVRRDLLTFVLPELVTEGGLIYKGKRLSNEMVRKDYRAVMGNQVDDLVAFGAQLQKRRRVLRRIQHHPRTKIQFLFPDTMKRDHELLLLFKQNFNAPATLINEYEAVLGAIDVPAYRGLVDRLAALHAGPVEHFVLQLQFDRQQGVPAMPPRVGAYLKGLLHSTAINQRVAAVARDQLSGQLAELAGSAPITRTVLTKLSGNIFDSSAWDTPRCFATMILFKELSAELGVDQGAVLAPLKQPDREAASHVYAALIAKPPRVLRDGARKVWTRLFGRPMPVIGGPGK